MVGQLMWIFCLIVAFAPDAVCLVAAQHRGVT